MVTIQYYLKNPKSRVSPIYISVYVKGKRLVPISVGISVVCDRVEEKNGKLIKGDWDKDKQRVRKTHDFADEINFRLDGIRLKVGRQFYAMLQTGRKPTGYDLQEIVKPGETHKKGGKVPHTVKEFYEKFRDTVLAKENRGVPDWQKLPATRQKGYTYSRQPKPLVDKLTEFAPSTSLRAFVPNQFEQEQGESLMEKFFDWLHEKHPESVQDTTLRSYTVAMRRLLKFAGMPYDWLEKADGGSATKYALTWKEIMQLHDYDQYSSREVADAADVSIIISQMALRWGDFSTLQPEHFIEVETKRHGKVWCINKSQSKTGSAILVPAPPVSEALLIKHNFRLPLPRTRSGYSYRHHLSDLMKDAAAEAKLTRQIRLTKTYNKQVKEFWEPLHTILSPHDLRHTGATLIMQASDKDKELVKFLLGHRSKSVTDDYIHLDPIGMVDDLLDAWAKIETGS